MESINRNELSHPTPLPRHPTPLHPTPPHPTPPQLDSITHNELGDPGALARLPPSVRPAPDDTTASQPTGALRGRWGGRAPLRCEAAATLRAPLAWVLPSLE
jgi:hypothetical protein